MQTSYTFLQIFSFLVASTIVPLVSCFSATNKLHFAPSIRHIADDYEVFLLDMWGVMHDGIQPYEGVLQAVEELKAAEREMMILSNSSKRKANAVKMLTKLGFDPSDFSKIITSGEVAHHLLVHLAGVSEEDSGSSSSWVPSKIPQVFQDISSSSSRKVFCFGSGDGDKEYLESSGWEFADSLADTVLIVARGTFVIQDASSIVDKAKDGEEVYFNEYEKKLEEAAKRNIPMVVCNPDKIRPDADRSPMPGEIGVTYQRLLEKNGIADSDEMVLYLGKPFADVYEIALRDCPGKKACMVGDALETDCTGAMAAGIESVWVVMNGIHNSDIKATASKEVDLAEEGNFDALQTGCSRVLEAFNEGSNDTYARGKQLYPTTVLPYFQW